jgi:hypothetical protein
VNKELTEIIDRLTESVGENAIVDILDQFENCLEAYRTREKRLKIADDLVVVSADEIDGG